MRRTIAVALALLFGGCAFAPEYTPESCVEMCRECGIVDCGEFCGILDDRLHTEACGAHAENTWDCVSALGCDFPLQCRAQVADLYACR